MSTPGGYGPSDNNPYGNIYGSPQYGAPAPYGPPPAGPGATGGSAPLDGVSIASLVLSLMCCTSLIGLILGFVGLSRTKNGQRSGRWAAVAGIAVGAVGIIASIGVMIAVIASGAFNQITPESAEAGQCLNIRDEGDTVYLTEKDCTDPHDGEILWVGDVEEMKDNAPDYVPDDINDLTDAAIAEAACGAMLDEDDLDRVDDADEDLEWGMATEDPEDISDSDTVVCYVESDEKLTGPVID